MESTTYQIYQSHLIKVNINILILILIFPVLPSFLPFIGKYILSIPVHYPHSSAQCPAYSVHCPLPNTLSLLSVSTTPVFFSTPVQCPHLNVQYPISPICVHCSYILLHFCPVSTSQCPVSSILQISNNLWLLSVSTFPMFFSTPIQCPHFLFYISQTQLQHEWWPVIHLIKIFALHY